MKPLMSVYFVFAKIFLIEVFPLRFSIYFSAILQIRNMKVSFESLSFINVVMLVENIFKK